MLTNHGVGEGYILKWISTVFDKLTDSLTAGSSEVSGSDLPFSLGFELYRLLLLPSERSMARLWFEGSVEWVNGFFPPLLSSVGIYDGYGRPVSWGAVMGGRYGPRGKIRKGLDLDLVLEMVFSWLKVSKVWMYWWKRSCQSPMEVLVSGAG